MGLPGGDEEEPSWRRFSDGEPVVRFVMGDLADSGWGALMTTRVGLFLGGRGGVLAPPTLLTVATLALEPIESLLDATLILDGDDAPLYVFSTVVMLSVDAERLSCDDSSSVRPLASLQRCKAFGESTRSKRSPCEEDLVKGRRLAGALMPIMRGMGFLGGGGGGGTASSLSIIVEEEKLFDVDFTAFTGPAKQPFLRGVPGRRAGSSGGLLLLEDSAMERKDP